VELLDNGSLTVMNCADPTGALREIISRYRPVETPGLPRFYGGAVGYLGYDMVRHFEKLDTGNADTIDAWDSWFMITDSLLILTT